MSVLDNTRLEFDAERRAFHKLEIKGVHHKQANDAVNPEIAGKLEAKSGDVAGTLHVSTLSLHRLCFPVCVVCNWCGETKEGIKENAFTLAYATCAFKYCAADVHRERVALVHVGCAVTYTVYKHRHSAFQRSPHTSAFWGSHTRAI